MDEILASIRRILTEDEKHLDDKHGGVMPKPENVLQLDPSMMVADPQPAVPESATAGLVAPAAAAAAATSVGSLVRTLTAERAMQVHSGGPTIEDIVREEIRPMLKAWLDTNLPPMVERLVRAEIERVVGRAVP
jgi:cell pole-organizing protein PopZ